MQLELFQTVSVDFCTNSSIVLTVDNADWPISSMNV